MHFVTVSFYNKLPDYNKMKNVLFFDSNQLKLRKCVELYLTKAVL